MPGVLGTLTNEGTLDPEDINPDLVKVLAAAAAEETPDPSPSAAGVTPGRSSSGTADTSRIGVLSNALTGHGKLNKDELYKRYFYDADMPRREKVEYLAELNRGVDTLKVAMKELVVRLYQMPTPSEYSICTCPLGKMPAKFRNSSSMEEVFCHNQEHGNLHCRCKGAFGA